MACFPHHGQPVSFNYRLLRTWRLDAGLRREQVCAAAGISFGYLRHIEDGTRHNPSIAVLTRVAEALGHSVSELFTDDDPELAGAR
jgi:transcriptional regulator with XRE-family HTH domain